MASRDLENKAGRRLFDNPILEALTKSTPTIIMGTYLPVIVGLVVYSAYNGYIPSVGVGVGIFAGAFLIWTLFEYLMHRFLFHVIEGRPGFERAYQLLHGMHHDHPRDPKRLFMPPIAGLTLATLYFGLFYLIMGTHAFVFLAGFVLGYLTYVMGHYAMHRYSPPFEWMKPLWRHHHLHHSRFPDQAFGVSSPLWDRVFGSMPPLPKSKRKERTA